MVRLGSPSFRLNFLGCALLKKINFFIRRPLRGAAAPHFIRSTSGFAALFFESGAERGALAPPFAALFFESGAERGALAPPFAALFFESGAERGALAPPFAPKKECSKALRGVPVILFLDRFFVFIFERHPLESKRPKL